MCASIRSSNAFGASGVPGSVVGAAGYVTAYGVAEDNLTLGHTVIADSVNGLGVTRAAWLAVADRSAAPAVELEVVCRTRRNIAAARKPGFPTYRV